MTRFRLKWVSLGFQYRSGVPGYHRVGLTFFKWLPPRLLFVRVSISSYQLLYSSVLQTGVQLSTVFWKSFPTNLFGVFKHVTTDARPARFCYLRIGGEDVNIRANVHNFRVSKVHMTWNYEQNFLTPWFAFEQIYTKNVLIKQIKRNMKWFLLFPMFLWIILHSCRCLPSMGRFFFDTGAYGNASCYCIPVCFTLVAVSDSSWELSTQK